MASSLSASLSDTAGERDIGVEAVGWGSMLVGSNGEKGKDVELAMAVEDDSRGMVKERSLYVPEEYLGVNEHLYARTVGQLTRGGTYPTPPNFLVGQYSAA